MPPRSITGGGDAPRLAFGSIMQQASGVAGLVAMLAIVTVLARRLTLAEFGVYGLLASLAGYLLVIQNAAAGAAVAGIAAAREPRERSRAFSSAVVVYAAAGAIAGVIVAGAGIALSLTVEMPSPVARQARLGSLLLGLVTLVGWPLTVYRDALRADQRFARVAVTEMVAVVAYAAIVLLPALAGADLALVIAASGALPLLVGIGCLASHGLRERPVRAAVSSRAVRDFARLAGHLSLAEAANASIYALNRVILGVMNSSALVAIYEGPVRAQNLIRSLSSAITVTALPAASRYRADRDLGRQRQLLLRGARYSLALIVPLAVTGIVLAGPVLEVWLGSEFGEGEAALAILLAYWLVTAPTGVVSALLVASGKANVFARYAGAVAVANLVLALALASPFGLEGVALATSLPYAVAFPGLLRRALAVVEAPFRALVSSALVPAYVLAIPLAAALVALRLSVSLDSVAAVAGVAVAALGAYWVAYYAIWLDAGERRLVADVVRGFARLRPGARP